MPRQKEAVTRLLAIYKLIKRGGLRDLNTSQVDTLQNKVFADLDTLPDIKVVNNKIDIVIHDLGVELEKRTGRISAGAHIFDDSLDS